MRKYQRFHELLAEFQTNNKQQPSVKNYEFLQPMHNSLIIKQSKENSSPRYSSTMKNQLNNSRNNRLNMTSCFTNYKNARYLIKNEENSQDLSFNVTNLMFPNCFRVRKQKQDNHKKSASMKLQQQFTQRLELKTKFHHPYRFVERTNIQSQIFGVNYFPKKSNKKPLATINKKKFKKTQAIEGWSNILEDDLSELVKH